MRPNARRIEALERRAEALDPGRGERRARMGEMLSLLAAARRGRLDEQEEPEVRAFWAAFERRAAEAKGGGGKL